MASKILRRAVKWNTAERKAWALLERHSVKDCPRHTPLGDGVHCGPKCLRNERKGLAAQRNGDRWRWRVIREIDRRARRAEHRGHAETNRSLRTRMHVALGGTLLKCP